MVYMLQKFRHYLLERYFKMHIYHSVLKYLVSKPMLGEKICQWLLWFQQYDFEAIVKPGRLNARLGYLSRIEKGEVPNSLEEGLSDV